MPRRDPIKAYDARWETGEFSDDEIRRLLEAALQYGRLLGATAVTLTRDGRLDAGHVLDLAMEAALRMGFHVFLRTDPTSTPQAYFTALHVSRNHPQTMGLAVTASHNPKNYVGVKFTAPIVRAIGIDCGPLGGLARIRELYHSEGRFPSRAGGTLTLLDLNREYIEFSLALAGVRPDDLSGIGVVVDGLHGSAGPELFSGLTRAGARVEPLRIVPDGHFPTGLPNPTSIGKMQQAAALAGEKNCAAFAGLDGDGDRLVFGDRRGLLTAGFAIIPILEAAVAAAGLEAPVALYDPKVSPTALAEWGRSGVRPLLFRNGHSPIKDYMSTVDAVAAVEESGHYYHRLTFDNLTVYCENTLLTALWFLKALRRRPELMDWLWQLQRQFFATGEFNYRLPDDATRDQAIQAVCRRFAQEGARLVTTTPEGLRIEGTSVIRGVRFKPGGVDLEPGWYCGNLRPSTNEKSVARSYFCAQDEPAGRRAETIVREVMEERFGGEVVD